MTDPFLENRVRDLLATASRQLASRWFDAALDSCRTALAATEDALSLDPSNQTALLLRQQVIDATARVQSAPPNSVEPARDDNARLPVKVPAFELLPEGATPLLENHEELLGGIGGGYLPQPETLSILDTTPHPEKTDYLRILAALAAIGLAAVALRVVTYYSTSHVHLDTAPLEERAQTHPPAPSISSEQSNAGPIDDTIYFADPDVTLPILRSKYEPKASAPGNVVLMAVIDRTGKPVNPQVWHGLSPDLNIQALEAAAKWRFRPGQKDGKPVPVTAQLEIHFQKP